MKLNLWGARGSLPAPAPETFRYGGNTACVSVSHANTTLILDAGTGLRRVDRALPRPVGRVDILLTHLHLDHIQGLGFFGPLFDPEAEVHIWGPASPTRSLATRLTRYLSPPIFPVPLRDATCRLELHEVPGLEIEIGAFSVEAAFVLHPGPTVGFRVTCVDGVATYLPDHEPALGARSFPPPAAWTSGASLAAETDILLHDAQYREDEYGAKAGWGHSTVEHALAFARLVSARHLVLFHHDPTRTDDEIDRLTDDLRERSDGAVTISAAREGAVYEVSGGQVAAG